MSLPLVQCGVCQQPRTEEQPTFCLHCLIPITAYKLGNFIGNPNSSAVTDQAKKITIDNANEAVENLGITHLSVAEQAVALSSLAREKMNPMSGDYEFSQAGQLAIMGKMRAKEMFEQWAHEMTITVHSIYLIRIGQTQEAINQLEDIAPNMPINTDIERLRRLETNALLTLSYRLDGKIEKADENLVQNMKEIRDEYEQTEILLTRYLEEADIKSEYLGLNNRITRFPRLDYFTRILAVLVEESIARGGIDTPLPDDTLDRMLELDNITHQLARISPPDDPGFFAAQLREYLRLFNGIFWYGDIMINNDGTKRRLLIERAYSRIHEWIEFLPVHFWLSLRLSRFLEVFTRAESWSDNIKVDTIIEKILDKSSKLHKPSFFYMFAEFNANTGVYDKALEYIKELLSPNYEKDLDPALGSMAQELQQSIELENVGILTGVTKSSDWMKELLQVTFDDNKFLEVDTQSELMQYGIAIFGDRLLEQNPKVKENIISVGPRKLDDSLWETSNLILEKKQIDGVRMDMVLVQGKLGEDNISLLFEGKKQSQITLNETTTRLEPSELLLLRAVHHTKELRVNDIIQFLSDLLTGHLLNQKHYASIMTLARK
ncbi:MAG: hypothetical protein HeimC2_15490 [Candidatus Heimdallarchaeota archaeon LC_2]|nr:MAG: hypothetical protein HeimC2_15490 [Candidatus Heimdallarchaeota archaeon LC_2]